MTTTASGRRGLLQIFYEIIMFDVTHDTLLDGRVTLLQPATGYRVAIDPVLLASAFPDDVGGEVLDAGCGAGAVMVCVRYRRPDVLVRGLELNPVMAGLAEQSLAANGWPGRVQIGDITGKGAGGFDAVLSNPPYHSAGTRSPNPHKDMAHSQRVALNDWIAGCLRRLKVNGMLGIIHQAEALGEILAALAGKAGAVEVIPLWPQVGQPASRVIVRARKGRKTDLQILPGVVLHEAGGAYTDAAQRLLRMGHSLDAVMGV